MSINRLKQLSGITEDPNEQKPTGFIIVFQEGFSFDIQPMMNSISIREPVTVNVNSGDMFVGNINPNIRSAQFSLASDQIGRAKIYKSIGAAKSGRKWIQEQYTQVPGESIVIHAVHSVLGKQVA